MQNFLNDADGQQANRNVLHHRSQFPSIKGVLNALWKNRVTDSRRDGNEPQKMALHGRGFAFYRRPIIRNVTVLLRLRYCAIEPTTNHRTTAATTNDHREETEIRIERKRKNVSRDGKRWLRRGQRTVKVKVMLPSVKERRYR